MNGIINVYKEAGYTSHDVVARLRGILKMKKIGHTGTLDPDATGVLPVCLGKATKLCDMLTDKRKTYEAEMVLGVTTDTQDMSGQILSEQKVTVSKEEAEAAVLSFLGEQMQVPPMYSALKVDGKKLYELAREGKTIERKARPVHFYRIEILDMDLPTIKFSVTCSKGTYIRTLCNDIGEKLGCGGAMKTLIRTEVERFRLEDSLTLSEIEEKVQLGQAEQIVMPLDQMFDHLPAVFVSGNTQQRVYNGNSFYRRFVKDQMKESEDGEQIRVYDEEKCFVGIYRYRKETDECCLVKMFRDGSTRS